MLAIPRASRLSPITSPESLPLCIRRTIEPTRARDTSLSSVKNIGIAESLIVRNEDIVLAAPNLGSCLGIAVYDPVTKMAGMIHCLLPLSKSDPEKAKNKPTMYVDTGVAYLLDRFLQNGSTKKNLQISVAGGAEINDNAHVFQIGKKNITVCRKILWKNDLLIRAQDTGGDSARTISLHTNSGEVWLRSKGVERRLE